MPAAIKPLFRPEAVRPKVTAFALPPTAVAARAHLSKWAKLLAAPATAKRKETELLPDFLRDVFVDLLGYVPPPQSPYTLKREALVDAAFCGPNYGVGRERGGRERDRGTRDTLDKHRRDDYHCLRRKTARRVSRHAGESPCSFGFLAGTSDL